MLANLDCIFCQIAAKKIPADIVYEDKEFLAFLDIKPVNPGHTLLVPKTHTANLGETPDELVGQSFITAKKLMGKIKLALQADFVALSVVGVDVPHFHIHLIPRFKKDGLANFWPIRPSTTEARQALAAKILAETSSPLD